MIENKNPPYDNCSYKVCDLPGQCISEGKCHHPKENVERKSQTHFIKSHLENYRDITSGKRLFDVRNDDRGYEVNDYVVFREFNPERNAYTGRWMECLITRIADSGEISKWLKRGIASNMVVIGFRGIQHHSTYGKSPRIMPEDHPTIDLPPEDAPAHE